MSTVMDKTKKLKRRYIKIDKLLPNPENPNEMTSAEFNLLHDNVSKMGITDPILIRAHPKIKGKYRIIGGEHRWEVAKLLDFTEVPCTIVDDPDFDEDQERFQLVRHNIIHGKMSPQKFMKLYDSLSKKYSDEIVAESFGFVEEEEFKKLINKTASTLPKELQSQFKDAAQELKTIDDLSKLLNTMFQQYGDTLHYGYMVLDYGGKDSIWLRMLGNQFKDFLEIADELKERGKTVDHFMAKLLQLIAKGKLGDFNLDDFVKDMPDVVIVEDIEIGTLDFLDE